MIRIMIDTDQADQDTDQEILIRLISPNVRTDQDTDQPDQDTDQPDQYTDQS